MSTIVINGGKITVLPPKQWAMQTHDEADCSGRECVVHAPTDHHMREWRLEWRFYKGLFERICEHRVGHPDPDQRVFFLETAHRRNIDMLSSGMPSAELESVEDFVDSMMSHTCDGCCGNGFLSGDDGTVAGP